MKSGKRNYVPWPLFILFVLSLIALKGCSDSSTNPENEEVDRISGIFFLGGKQITTTYSDWPIPEGDKPTRDTTSIGFITKLQVSKDDNDQLRIYGLEGADVGKYENRVYPDCTHPDDCKIYGQMTGVEDFEVDITNQERTYKGSGKIRTLDFELRGEYQYQNVVIEYHLGGARSL